MDALELLEEDHKRFKEILKEGEETTERARAGRKKLFERLTRELVIHERMEEEVLYPALKAHPEAKDIVLEGFEEHHLADMIVAELNETDVSDETWGAKWKVLKESLEHHIEEEEDEMFKKAKKIFDKDQRAAMGQEMEAIRASEKRSQA